MDAVEVPGEEDFERSPVSAVGSGGQRLITRRQE
jgi:hypothetical protein